MHEILFRGKHIDKGFVYGYVGVFKGTPQIYVPFTAEEEKANEGHIFSAIGGLWYTVLPETVGQFTGLTDKNGKKIYEGDIIQHGKRKGTIFYYGNFGMFMISWIPNGGANIFMNVLHTEVEVIGNIHDNPELLDK